MAFLTVSGFAVPISATGVSLERQGHGEQAISYGGKQQPPRWGVTRVFDLSSPLTTRADAQALSGLISGDGHFIPFDTTLYSTKGLGPNIGYTITMSAAGGAVGGGYVQVTSAQTLTYTFSAPIDRTFMVCKFVGAAWVHYALTYDASTGTTVQYKNGVPHTPIAGDSVANWFSYNATYGYWQLEGKTIAGVAGNARYDQMVMAPYVMTAEMIAAFDTEILTTGLPFSPLPALRVSGDVIPDGPQLYVGSIPESSYQVAAVASGDNIGLDLKFNLIEYQARLT